MRTHLVLIFVVACVACATPVSRPTTGPAGDPPPAEGEVSDGAAGAQAGLEPVEPQATPQPQRPAPTAADAAADKKKINEFNELLNKGRVASKAGRFEEAQRLLTEALALDPTDPAVLGELGFVALKAGDLAAARLWTQRALATDPYSDKRPAVLYNLGLIAEKEGDVEGAAEAWEQSLALRPNKTVDKSLTALRAAHPVRTHRGGLDEVCVQALEYWTCEQNEGEPSCVCETDVLLQPDQVQADSPIRNFAVIHVDGEAGGLVDADHLAVETRTGGWQLVAQLANRWNPGCCYVNNDGSFTLDGLDDLLALPGLELHVHSSNSHSDDDPGVYSSWAESVETDIWCLAPDGKPMCVEVISAHSTWSGPIDLEMWPEDERPAADELPAEKQTRYELSVELVEPHHLQIGIVEGKADLGKAAAALPGKHDLVGLEGLEGVRVIPLD